VLRFTQTFAGLRDSSLPDQAWHLLSIGTTEVAINYQYGKKTQYWIYWMYLHWDSAHISAVALGNDAAILALSHWRLYLSWLWTGLAGSVLGRLYVNHHGQSVWIQSITEFRVMSLLKSVWDSRVGLAGVQDSVARAVSWYSDNRYSAYELKQTSILKSFINIRDYSHPLQLDAATKQSSLPRLPTSATPTQHGRPDRTIYASTTEATDTTTTTEMLDYCTNCVTFGLTV